jgi:DNA-directed RNA polymerase specialized sigma24 family protein
LGDRALIDAMREGDDWAFGEFLGRFRPVMLAYAQGRIPDVLIPECVDDVLEDTAIDLADPRATVPSQLRAWLVGAVRRRHLALLRSSTRRRRWYEEAARAALCTSDGREAVVPSVCAESTVAASRGLDAAEARETTAVEQLALLMMRELSDEEQRILSWLGHSVPHRQIAAWLGRSYEATTKQIWRLCRRLARAAPAYAATMPDSVQRELERFFVRAQRGRRPA